MIQPQDVLDFWLSPEVKAKWFEKDEGLDAKIRERFEDAVERAGTGAFDSWAETAQGALALLLLLDQFPRNLYRGQARAFAHDAKACEVARRVVARGLDKQLDEDGRLFCYLPFEHSEALADQHMCMALFEGLGNDGYLDYARRHKDIVERFGRFPHRNAALDRASTPEEAAFLEGPDSSF